MALFYRYVYFGGRTCAPPANKPAPQELLNCAPYLLEEIALLTQTEGLVALGRIAFERLLNIYLPKGSNCHLIHFLMALFIP